MVNDLAVCPQQSMDTRRSEARMLLLDLFYLLLQSLIVFWMRLVAGTGTGHFTTRQALRSERPLFVAWAMTARASARGSAAPATFFGGFL